jgi:hypothetical protein
VLSGLEIAKTAFLIQYRVVVTSCSCKRAHFFDYCR